MHASITDGTSFPVPKQAVIIGGGNVAMDIARSLGRLQVKKYGKLDVTLTALEAEDQMLADADEIREAREEGIAIYPGRGPKACVVKGKSLKGLETVRCVSIFDESGRFHPHYDESDPMFHPADMVVEAIGQAPDLDFLGPELTERLEWSRGRPTVDPEGRTALPWLWAAGDVVEGPDVIHAIAGGHRIAAGIDRALSAASAAA